MSIHSQHRLRQCIFWPSYTMASRYFDPASGLLPPSNSIIITSLASSLAVDNTYIHDGMYVYIY